MNDLLLFPHLGLGDLVVCNALVRQLAAKRKVWVLCRPRNVESARFMWRDDHNIELLELPGDFEKQENHAKAFAEFAHKEHSKEVLGLGLHGSRPFDLDRWDQEMYRQAGLDFQKLRWNGFKVARQPSREFELPGKKYIFVHDDPSRGFGIDPARLPKNRKVVKPEPLAAKQGGPANIFDWWGVIEGAEEIHCIDSAFLCLIDSLPCLKAKKFVFHKYARAEGKPPSTVKGWEVLT